MSQTDVWARLLRMKNWTRSEGTEGEEQRWEGESGQEIKKLALVSSNLLIVEHYVLVKEIPGC